MIKKIDFCYSSAVCALKYRYSKPNICKKESYIELKAVRHPLAERNIKNHVAYSAFDFNDKNILLFGVNGSGKSTYMKAVCICIMAQIGYFVPCTEMNFYPFDNIITRMSTYDNIDKMESSFTNELKDIRIMIENSNKNSFIIADELVKGTEYISSYIITKNSIKYFIEKKSSFIFSTHISELKKENFSADIKMMYIDMLHYPYGSRVMKEEV